MYVKPFFLKTGETKVSAIARRGDQVGVVYSGIATNIYLIISNPIPPRFSPLPGTFMGAVEILLSREQPFDDIYYTTDGKEPDTKSLRYNCPIKFSKSGTYTVKAKSIRKGGVVVTESAVVTGVYKIVIPAPSIPTVLPKTGFFGSRIVVTMQASNNNEIRYSFGYQEPSLQSNKYTGVIVITKPGIYIVRARAVNADGTLSASTFSVYTVPPNISIFPPRK